MRQILENIDVQLKAATVAPRSFGEVKALVGSIFKMDIPLSYLGHIYHLMNMVNKAHDGPPSLQSLEGKIKWSTYYVKEAQKTLDELLSW